MCREIISASVGFPLHVWNFSGTGSAVAAPNWESRMRPLSRDACQVLSPLERACYGCASLVLPQPCVLATFYDTRSCANTDFANPSSCLNTRSYLTSLGSAILSEYLDLCRTTDLICLEKKNLEPQIASHEHNSNRRASRFLLSSACARLRHGRMVLKQ